MFVLGEGGTFDDAEEFDEERLREFAFSGGMRLEECEGDLGGVGGAEVFA